MAAREDFSEGLDSRKTGERLQKRFRTILRGETPERPRALERTEETCQSSSCRRDIQDLVHEGYHPKSIEEMERASGELEKAQNQQVDGTPNPNPRKLG